MEVLENPNSDLRIRSIDVPVEEIGTEQMKQFITELKDTMALENGVGIAAPQVGVRKRLIVVETDDGPQAFFNPKITQRSFRKIDSEEGCLSVPGVFGMVTRHRRVVVEALNEQGAAVTIRAFQFPAIVFQHEIDHLDGILFIDKVTRFTKNTNL